MREGVAFYKQNWWLYLIQGVVTLLFGIFAVFQPGEVFAILGFYFGLFLIIAGLTDTVLGISSVGKRDYWWLTMLLGIIELGIGVYLFRRPGLSIATFVVFVAIALLIKGIFAFVEAFDKNLESGTKALYAIGGIAGILASIIIWRYPIQGTLAFVWVLGFYALVTGPIMIAFAFKAKEGFKS